MAHRIFSVIVLFVFCCVTPVSAQEANRYMVYFTDKNNSPYSISAPNAYLSQRAIDRRTRQSITITTADLPVDSAYLDSINSTGAQVVYASRWFNAAVIGADSVQLVQISQFSFVKTIDMVRGSDYYARLSKNNSTPTPLISRVASITGYQTQLSMIGVDSMHQKGYHGEGMLITMLDAGFINAPNRSFFDSLFLNNQIIATYDFVLSQPNVYQSDDHGTETLSLLAANQPGVMMGTAYKADYILLVTEDVTSESPVEEANWLRGAEYADSAGTDVISCSLGYNTFDNPAFNLTYSDLNGHTSIASRAASMAAARGILVCNSAGNQGGQESWPYILVPADADSIIAVGAVDGSGNYAYFSSIGPTSDGRIKPDLVAQGLNTTVGLSTGTTGTDVGTDDGTSFSCPLVAGLAAGFWQAFPKLKNVDVIQYLKQSASQYTDPDDLLGYGIPFFPKAYDLAAGITYVVPPQPRTLKTLYPNPVSGSLKLTAILASDTGPVIYELTDVSGKIIANGSAELNANSTLEIEVEQLISGMYFVTITSASGTYRAKFIKIG